MRKVVLLLFVTSTALAFQTDLPSGLMKKLEAGLFDEKDQPAALFHLSDGNPAQALGALTQDSNRLFPWLPDYLEGWKAVSDPLVPMETDHFMIWTPPHQTFLADYARPALEEARDAMKKTFGYAPREKIRVEIYPTKEDFSAASTLSMETLERSGAIGICKFHRLMIVSPQALPLGYRWLDALAHEYNHLIINELSHAEAELWLHEGTARHFDTRWRSDPPEYLSPHQKTKLMEAQEEDRLISFKRMSPSLVYLKDQEEVSLAFAQVSHAVGVLIERDGAGTFVKFLKEMRSSSFPKAFQKIYKQSPEEFETDWRKALAKEQWEKVRGALSDEVRFEGISEEEEIGAAAQGHMRLGDRMRMRKRFEAALIQYEKALQEEPDNALILLKAARTQLVLKDNDGAVRHLRRAVRRNPNYVTPYIELAHWVDADEAETLLREANQINPFDPRIHAGLARLYERRGDVEETAFERGVLKLVSPEGSRRHTYE